MSAYDLDDYVQVHVTVQARLELVDLRGGNAVALGVPTNAVRASSHRTGRRLAAEGLVEASLTDRARPQQSDDRLVRLVACIKAAALDRALQQIAAQIEAMRERTPRCRTRSHRSSVKHLLTQAESLRLAGAASIKV